MVDGCIPFSHLSKTLKRFLKNKYILRICRGERKEGGDVEHDGIILVFSEYGMKSRCIDFMVRGVSYLGVNT